MNMEELVGTHDIALMTLDTLRFDVAQSMWKAGRIPNFAKLLPPTGWQERHAPGSFTYASHQAMFAGFLPTPSEPGPHPRLFAMRFAGSESIGAGTCVLDAATIMEGLAALDYHSLCIGGTGFFNTTTPLGRVLPGLFSESHWNESLGVTRADSTANQFSLVADSLSSLPKSKRAFVFVNVSALHQPNYFYIDGREQCEGDNLESQGAALVYVDSQLPMLLDALSRRGPSLLIICSDHGTAYGEAGHTGHRLAHKVVWTVPYMHTLLPHKKQTYEP